MPADETVLAILSPAKMSKTWRTGKMNCASVLGARLVSREKLEQRGKFSLVRSERNAACPRRSNNKF